MKDETSIRAKNLLRDDEVKRWVIGVTEREGDFLTTECTKMHERGSLKGGGGKAARR